MWDQIEGDRPSVYAIRLQLLRDYTELNSRPVGARQPQQPFAFGFVNHINLDDSDTFLELAGDYYFTEQFSAGISLEFAGDNDAFTIGARWYFR